MLLEGGLQGVHPEDHGAHLHGPWAPAVNNDDDGDNRGWKPGGRCPLATVTLQGHFVALLMRLPILLSGTGEMFTGPSFRVTKQNTER